jgi:O-antigen ligase
MVIWEASSACVAQHFFTGTGTGSANNVLMGHYQTHGMTIAFKEHLNAHNQYLQTFITLGIFGFIGLISMLFYPISQAISNRDLLYKGFLFIFILNIFVESMLDTQAGNLFFAFFNALLFMNSSHNQES